MNLLVLIVIMLSNDATIATTTDERNTAAAQCLREQRALAAAAASHSFGLSTDRAEPFSPEEAALAAGVSHATRGGGLWHVPSPPPPLPQLAIGECPSKSAFGYRERDRPHFSASEWRLRRRMHTTPPALAIGTLVGRVGTRPTTLQTSAPSPVETPTCPPPMAVACVCRC
mmetsp:Transcript_13677/g.40539  ORF Transcript_13677/g.40539 Transcript_13677/m.40539 type:complete len:171 (-) Transcript_13677:76-588(-)